MERRRFLKFAGTSGFLSTLLGRSTSASAATWHNMSAVDMALPPVRVLGPRAGFAPHLPVLAASSSTMTVLRSDRQPFAVGYNQYGQLGAMSIGATATSFVQVVGVSSAIAVCASTNHTVALRADGLVFSTGRNGAGQLGIGTTTNQSTFVQAVGISNAIAVAVGGSGALAATSLALRGDGTLWGCGYNASGQLGNNSLVSALTYVSALSMTNVIGIACGYMHSLAIRGDGTLWAAGNNLGGALGIGTVSGARSSFVQALGMSNVVAVAGGQSFSVALRSDGTVWASGANTSGQLGNNSSLSASSFVQAIGISSAVAIAAGSAFALALRSDGLVFGVGNSSSGQTGSSGTIHSTYVQATGVSNVVAIGCGGAFGLALRSDGKLFTCGYNASYNLGDGSNVSRSTFAPAVMSP